MAGVDPTDHAAAAAGLPPIDAIDQWPYLSGAASSPRKELAIGGCANPKDNFCGNSATQVEGVIAVQDDGKVYKLLMAEIWQDGWTGCVRALGTARPSVCLFITCPRCHRLFGTQTTTRPDYPNNTKVVDYNKYYAQCTSGCLFELVSDPTEHVNLTTAEPTIVTKLTARIKALQAGVFSPNRGKVNQSLVCGAVANKYSGFWGPFVDAE